MRFSSVVLRGVFAAAIVAGAWSAAQGEVLPASSGLLLGQGYDGAGGVFRAMCADGTVDYDGAPKSSVRDDRPLSEAELRAMLGVAQSDGSAVPILPRSQVLAFLQTAAPQKAAIAVTFAYDVRGKRAVLRSPRMTAKGEVAAELAEADRLRMCGDEVVTAIELGGSVFITLRFDFVTGGVQTVFSKAFDFEHVSAANLRGKLQRIGSEYKGKVTITLGALQIGGDVTKLATIFGNPAGDIALLRCQVDQVEQCAQAMERAHDYLFGVGGFREQLGEVILDPMSTTGPAMLKYETQSYASLKLSALVAANPSRESARAARGRMAVHHARIWADVEELCNTLGLSLTSTQQELASEALAIARQDAALLRFEIEQCGSHPELCASLEAEAEAALRPYSTRVAERPEWFLPLCREAALGTESGASIQPILDYFGESDCAKAAQLLRASHALIIRGAGIRDGRVFAWLDNLSSLDARENLISDPTPLATLPNLRALNLAYNALASTIPLAELPKLENAHLQGNPAADAAALRARLSADSFLTESDVCRATRRKLLASGAIAPDEHARYEQADAAPIYSAQRTIVRWAPCAEAARGLDP